MVVKVVKMVWGEMMVEFEDKVKEEEENLEKVEEQYLVNMVENLVEEKVKLYRFLHMMVHLSSNLDINSWKPVQSHLQL